MKYLDVLNGCFPYENSVKYLDQIVIILFLLLCQIEERVARDKPFWEIILLRLDMMAMVSEAGGRSTKNICISDKECPITCQYFSPNS